MQIATYRVDDRLLPRLADAAEQQAWLAAQGALTGPARAAIHTQQRLTFLVESARLQGNNLSAEEIAAMVAGQEVAGRTAAQHQEMRNLNTGLAYTEMLAAGDMALTERLIRVYHALVMRGLTAPDEPEAGAYRADDLRHLNYPVPTAAEVISEMGAFSRWLALKPDSPEYEPSPILRATYAHTRLLHIHPFHNGTGRVARLLLNLILLRAGYPVVAVSGNQPAVYIAGLDAASEGGDMTPILQMVLYAVEHALHAFAG